MKTTNMRFMRTAIATFSALYVAGISAASSTGETRSLRVDTAMDFNSTTIAARKHAQQQVNTPSMLEGDGRNVMVRPTKKFIPAEGDAPSHGYIIRLKDSPAALYRDANNNVMAAFANNQIGPRSQSPLSQPEVQSYVNELKQKQTSFVSNARAKAGVDIQVEHSFQVALNGVSATLSKDEAERISKLPEVASVRAVQTYELLMDENHKRFGTEGAWNNTSHASANGLMGEGMLVGVIDTGIDPEHPMFQATGDDGYTVMNPNGSGEFLHDCTLEGFEQLCNDKLIGIWSHPMITSAFADEEGSPYGETRPEVGIDYHGHGTHTASTAAGNIVRDVKHKLPAIAMTSDGIESGIVVDEVSGVAPHANIISYQACYPGAISSIDKYVGCPNVPLVAAIEQAIVDGVDVINYSISGGYDPHNDDIEMAFLAAHEAGINVAASAGNAGAYQSVNHVSPWVTSVASTQTGRFFGVEEFSRATDLTGGDTAAPYSYRRDIAGTFHEDITGPVVLASDFGNEFCEEPFTTTFSNNEIVYCARSDAGSEKGALVDKAKHVNDAGGAATIVYNTPTSGEILYYTLEADSPLGMQNENNGQAFVDWLSSGTGHTMTIPKSMNESYVEPAFADAISQFSSIGYAFLPEYREVTAPAIAAPGQDIFAADANDQPFTYGAQAAPGVVGPADYGVKSGTSMASPHIAGAMALIRQAHPDWSPSEVMSALQLTANDEVGDHLGRETDVINPWFYGSGIAQVDKAVNAGLIMHVPVDHYTKTNPYIGGNIGALNTPNMVDEQCFKTCTWIREVEATVDGTWDVSTQTGEYSVQVDVEPKQFTLKAGEKQRLVITGSWQNAQSFTNTARGATVFGKVKLEHQAGVVPTSEMSVEMTLDSGKLPEIVNYTANSDSATLRLSQQPLGNAPDPQVTIYEPVKGTTEQFYLREMPDGSSMHMFEAAQDTSSETLKVQWVDVPEGALRLVAEHLSSGAAKEENEYNEAKGNLGLYVGIDANGDGEIQYDDEVICRSQANNIHITEYCNIPYPAAGNYWVVWQENNKNLYSSRGKEDAWYEHTVSTAVVLNNIDADATGTVSGPSTPGDLTDISMTFDSLGLEKGERAYSAVELGTDTENTNNIGMVSTNIDRGDDAVSFRAHRAQAKPGDQLGFTLDVLPNLSGGDRSFSVTATIPEGLTLEDVQIRGNNFIESEVEMDGNTFTVSGVQHNSLDREPTYHITNSVTDQSCKTPVADGGYIDLLSYGIEPEPAAPHTMYDGAWQLPFNEMFENANEDEAFALYHNFEHATSDSLYVHPTGAMDLDGFVTGNYRFAEDNMQSPPQTMGVFWFNRYHPIDNQLAFGAPYYVEDADGNRVSDEDIAGITVTRLVDDVNVATHIVVEWDNLQHMVPKDGCDYFSCGLNMQYEPNPASDLTVDAQAIVARGYDHSPGAFEVIYAYDNMYFEDYDGNGLPIQANFGVVEMATAGIRGYNGPWGRRSPYFNWKNQSIVPHDDDFGLLDEYLKDGMVVCMDYDGPEVTAFSVDVTVSSDEHVIGQNFDVELSADIQGSMAKTMTQTIEFPSNITLFDIDDVTTMEEQAVTGIRVDFMDNNNVGNVISVSGEGFSATVNGHTSGSTIDIMPNPDFFGETEVMVKVADQNFPTDATTTSFMLNVMPVNDAPLVQASVAKPEVVEGNDVELVAQVADMDGDEITVLWEGPGSIANASAMSTTVSGLSVGTHTFTVTVSDGEMASQAQVSVEVKSQPEAYNGEHNSESSSGSFGWLLLPLSFLALGARRQKRK